MPHILAGPIYAKAGERLTMRVELRSDAIRGGFILECCCRRGRIRAAFDFLRGRPRFPDFWSPVTLATGDTIREIDMRGFGHATTVHGAVSEAAPIFERFVIAPIDAHYRLAQEATRFNPEPTASAKLSAPHVSAYETFRRLLAFG